MKMLPVLIAASVLISSTAMAQYPRNGRVHERRDGGFNVIWTIQADLERVASRGRLGGRVRRRIDQA